MRSLTWKLLAVLCLVLALVAIVSDLPMHGVLVAFAFAAAIVCGMVSLNADSNPYGAR